MEGFPGDSFFLFTSFPLDSALYADLPIKICEGLYLTLTPQDALQNERSPEIFKRKIAITEFVYPGFHLGNGICNVSIKIDALVLDTIHREKLFWTTICALLLIKPLYIHVSGFFTYGDSETSLIQNPGKYDLRSNIFNTLQFNTQLSEGTLHYNSEDIDAVIKILPILFNFYKPESNFRHSYNIQTFLQAMIFEKLHYRSSIYSKLFPLVDSLAGNPPWKHQIKVSERLGQFLVDIPFCNNHIKSTQQQIQIRLDYIWGLHRYPELHGHLKKNIFPPATTSFSSGIEIFPDKEDLEDLFDLVEISRVALLKSLLLEKESFAEYCEISVPLTGKSSQEAEQDNKNRDKKSKSFFDKSHKNSNLLIFYSIKK